MLQLFLSLAPLKLSIVGFRYEMMGLVLAQQALVGSRVDVICEVEYNNTARGESACGGQDNSLDINDAVHVECTGALRCHDVQVRGRTPSSEPSKRFMLSRRPDVT